MSSSSTLDLVAVNSRRRPWQPNTPKPNSETSKASATISRCLALTNLEPAVATFITTGLDRQDSNRLSPEMIQTLKRNIEDEAKHEIALTNARNAMLDYNSSFEHEAESICKEWLELSDNPIVTAAVLENAVFFPILNIYASHGASSLRQTAADISQDERGHVQTHRQAAMSLGVKPSRNLNRLRLKTIEFLSQDIYELGIDWNLDRMIKNSNNLLQKGISDLTKSKFAGVNAPFEISNENLPIY
jgi:hypothetical protein